MVVHSLRRCSGRIIVSLPPFELLLPATPLELVPDDDDAATGPTAVVVLVIATEFFAPTPFELLLLLLLLLRIRGG